MHIAKKYIDILKKTMHYRDLAEKYEEMIDNPSLISSDSELGEKIRLLPTEDFSINISDPHTNIPLILQGNPDNKKAFEYLAAWYLLQKTRDCLQQGLD